MIRTISAIDAHVGGQALRLVVEGFPRPLGRTPTGRRDWVKRNADSFRRSLVLPPRGHTDLLAALLTEPSSPQAHAGVILMDAAGYPSMNVEAIIATATIAIERGLIFSRDFEQREARLTFETAAGAARARARLIEHGGVIRVDAVALTNVPAFVHAGSQLVKIGSRQLRVDIAFGGAFYAIVDTEATGVPLTTARSSDLRRLGIEICSSLNTSGGPGHPLDPALSGIGGVVFTGPPQDPEAHLRNVTVGPSGSINASAGGTGTSAVMAVLDAMGLLPEGQAFVHEGLSGSLLRGRVVGRTAVGESAALVTEIEGSAWITGEHTFFLDDDDPMREGWSF